MFPDRVEVSGVCIRLLFLLLSLLSAVGATCNVPADAGPPDAGPPDASTTSCVAAVQVEPGAPTNVSATPSGLELCTQDSASYWRVDSIEPCVFPPASYPACAENACGSDCPSDSCHLLDGIDVCRCLPFCQAEEDCGMDEKCLCAAAVANNSGGQTGFANWSVCIEARCSQSNDCPEGEECRAATGISGEPQGAYCTTAADQCDTSADCRGGGYCSYDRDDARWECARMSVE